MNESSDIHKEDETMTYDELTDDQKTNLHNRVESYLLNEEGEADEDSICDFIEEGAGCGLWDYQQDAYNAMLNVCTY